MIADTTVINPFGPSIPDYTDKEDFGTKLTNVTGGALSRGSVVMPAFGDTAHSIDRTKYAGTGSLYSAVKTPADLVDDGSGTISGVANNPLFGYYGPFYVAMNAADDTIADNKQGRFFDGGPLGSFMEVRVNYDWTNDLYEGIALAPVSGQTYLGVADLTAVANPRPVARVPVQIPAGTFAAGTSTQLIRVLFRPRGI